MSGRLPLVLSIPHGGLQVPAEVEGELNATEHDILADGDAHTAELYDLEAQVKHSVTARVARAIVDLNRAPDDRPPDNPDGVVKTQTVHGVTLYRRPLPDAVAEELIRRYHAPYHERLEALAHQGDVVVGIDCHSMLAQPPPGFRDPAPRPSFCVSNAEGRTAPDAHVTALCDALRTAFRLPADEVRANDPFLGGYIVRRHGAGAVPWLQLEINRAMYLDPDTLHPLPGLAEMRDGLLEALTEFARRIG